MSELGFHFEFSNFQYPLSQYTVVFWPSYLGFTVRVLLPGVLGRSLAAVLCSGFAVSWVGFGFLEMGGAIGWGQRPLLPLSPVLGPGRTLLTILYVQQHYHPLRPQQQLPLWWVDILYFSLWRVFSPLHSVTQCHI